MTLEKVKRLKHEYCYHLDNGNVGEFLTLFTDEASFEVPNYGAGSGIEDVRDFIEHVNSQNFQLLAHMATNPMLEIDGGEASGHWYYIVIIEDADGNASWGQGRWEDEYRRIDGDWKISSLVATRQFTAQLSE